MTNLQNTFWNKHAYHGFSATAIALFFYLLHLQEVAGSDVIRVKNAQVLANLDISFHTLQAARQELENASILSVSTMAGSAFSTYDFTPKVETSKQTLANFAKVGNEVSNEVGNEVETSKQTLANFAKVGNEVSNEVKEENPPRPPKEENNNTLSNESDTHTREEDFFVPPTLEEVKEFVSSNPNLTLSADEFYYYYLQSGWKLSSGNQMKDWRAAVFSWQNKQRQFMKKQNNEKITYRANATDYEHDTF
ncbi:MAG: hypothetical protein IJP50_04575 [Paludibacteraceae bacterium]|nr:hypothetical protein [Paludibacteraceae bacterium]